MLKTRILTATALLGLFLPALFYLPSMLWATLTMVLTLIGLHEWAGFLQLTQKQTRCYLLVSAGLGMLSLCLLGWLGFHWFFYQTMLVMTLATLFWCVVVPVALYQQSFSTHRGFNLCVGWAVLMALWMALVTTQAIHPGFLLVMMSTIWMADSAAYFAGKNFGKHKLAPSISPGKTWEGVIGALLTVAVFGVLLKYLDVVTTWWILPFLCLVTIVGIYGDLFESLFKRRANLKDSGQLLPGHGGLLDRIDGVIPALPVGLCLVYGYHYLQQAYSF